MKNLIRNKYALAISRSIIYCLFLSLFFIFDGFEWLDTKIIGGFLVFSICFELLTVPVRSKCHRFLYILMISGMLVSGSFLVHQAGRIENQTQIEKISLNSHQ